ncbi:unnamed protein product [Cuscuta europaea]|uniref:Uncharacterized protein n=1 Tax=Cuscuta europaea TaxID=41803 RepID=A0A9P0Z174_CUSEU|nr:unnamed protein product [Cuscuta europaea]
MSPSKHCEVVSAIRHIALTLSSMPPKYGIRGENYYWSVGYQLNFRVYEKLLFGLFDILEEDHLIEEAAEILKLLKSSWSMLGITQKLHNVIYSWVLFQHVYMLCIWYTLCTFNSGMQFFIVFLDVTAM